MNSNIVDLKIKELGLVITGKTPSTKNLGYWGGRIPFVTPTDMGTGRFVKTERFLTKEGVVDVRNSLCAKGAVMVSCIGTIGKIAIAAEPVVTNQQINSIIPNETFESEYVYYLIQNSQSILKTHASGTGTTIPIINKSSFENIILKGTKDGSAQRKIAKILGDLDQKIEFNRKMNETLEQMGQALFKRYFVDNPEVKKWDMTTLRAMVSPQRGRSLQRRDMRDGCIPVVSGGLEPSGYHDESNTIAPVITISASGANAGYIRLWHNPIWSADSSFIDKRNTDYVYFFYIFLKTKQKDIYSAQTGAAQPHIYPSHLERLEIQNIPEEKIKEFCILVEPLFIKMGNIERENQTIGNLRDLLLPKLLSGKIRV